MKKILKIALILALLLLIICLVKTFSLKSIQPNVSYQTPIVVSDSALFHFQQGIQFPTVSNDSLPTDSIAFSAFHAFLATTYPHIFQLEKTTVAGYTFIIHWRGSQKSDSPVIFMAHQDVVPVEESSINEWKAPPFSGKTIGDTLYGRGAVDDKFALFALLEAAEKALREGYTPKRDIYFVFGHDEETHGLGAKAAVKWFENQHLYPKWVFDEGGEITAAVPGIEGKHVALIGTSEKGYMTVRLKASLEGGHSSMPAAETAIDLLASAIGKLRSQEFKATFSSSMDDFLNYLGPEMKPSTRFFVANRWLFNRMLLNIYAKSPAGNALIRTTVAPTILKAGSKENVIPNIATATINFRTAPGITTKNILDHIHKSIADNRITVEIVGTPREASHLTNIHSEGFQLLAKSIQENYPNTLIAPFLMIGGTDGRQFEKITKSVIRFSPAIDLKGMHGINERVGVQEFRNAIGLYYRMLKNVE